MNNEKTLKALGFFEVLNQLKSFSQNELTNQAISNLLPENELKPCQDKLQDVNNALSVILHENVPSTARLADVSNPINRLKKGGTCNIPEILSFGEILKLSRSFKSILSNHVFLPYADNLKSNKVLEDLIFSSIISETQIADAASPNLKQIRRNISNLQSKIKRDLDSFLRKSKALQENITTIKNGRIVVPVKIEKKSEVPGIVHDFSSSGSTIFVEPQFTVQLNNEIAKNKAMEEEEIEKIIRDISGKLAEDIDTIEIDFENLKQIDFIFAKANFALNNKHHMPLLNNNGYIKIANGKHPLIAKETIVPLNFENKDFKTLVITGPNTGGKTVALKTIGLFCLMASSGLFVPADEDAQIAIFDKIYADIGDEQSIEQSLSTFSSHMTNIIYFLKDLPSNSLVLFDELGAGTDPDEGAALAISILEYVRNAGCTCLATTHYAPLKLYGLTTENVKNASCEFNAETLMPTYRLIIGAPGKSNAFAISKRLGLKDEIIIKAKENLNSTHSDFEFAISSLHKQRRKLERINAKIKLEAETAENLKSNYAKKIEKLESSEEAQIARAKEKANKIIEEAREKSEEIIKELKSSKSEASIIKARTNLNQQQSKTSSKLEIPEELLNKSKVNFQKSETKKQQSAYKNVLNSGGGKSEIDLRGFTVDEGIYEAEKFIDQAIVNGLSTVSIIHGKGTGQLRQGIQIMLKNNKIVKSFRFGTFGEGEMGVTIVEL